MAVVGAPVQFPPERTHAEHAELSTRCLAARALLHCENTAVCEALSWRCRSYVGCGGSTKSMRLQRHLQ